MDNASVEEVAASLVREFLSRKGLKNTMIIMDQELPRSERSINNRNELRKLLNLESLYKQNKTNESPLKTALEIITRFFLEEFGKGSLPGMQDSASFVHHRKEVLQKGSESSAIDVYDISDNEDGGSTAVSNTSKTEISRPVEENSVRRTAGSMKSQSTNNTFPIAVVSSVSSSEGETKERQSIRKAQEEHMKFPDPLVEMKAGVTENLRLKSSRIVRGMAGPIASSQEDSLKKRSLRRPASATNIIPPKGDTRLRTTSEVPAENLQGPAAGFNEANTSAIQALNLGKDFAAKVLADSLTVSTKDRMRRVSLGTENATQNSTQKTVLENNGIEDTFRQKLSKTEIQERNTKSSFSHESSGDGQERRARGRRMEESQTSSQRMSFGSPSNLNEHRKQDIHLDDVDDELIPGEIEKIPAHFPSSRLKVESKAIDFSQAKEMKNLLFGSSLGCFSDEWKVQSFTFSEKPQLKYGIIQKKGGPCGVLAAVQGCVLQKLIFEESSDSRCSHVIKEKAFADSFECQPALLLERVSHGERCLKPSSPHRTNCLSMALADILWRAGTRDHAVVALHSGRQQFSPVGRYKADGILETLLLYTLTKYEDLTMFLQQNIHQFEMGPFGCILLTFSVVFSRSIDLLLAMEFQEFHDRVRADFDVPINSLIGAHGYCTQELVNLLLTGRAVSNVFNDVIELDSGNGNITVLKGIDVRSDIGFLSLFEHYDVCQVGSYLKTPKYPIWVVCSESHFSMLFCLRKELMNDWKMERRFDLYYYDGLAQQQEEIRLTVDTAAPYTEAKDEELVPPLEHCIRTKWKGARVDWNGTEPIL